MAGKVPPLPDTQARGGGETPPNGYSLGGAPPGGIGENKTGLEKTKSPPPDRPPASPSGAPKAATGPNSTPPGPGQEKPAAPPDEVARPEKNPEKRLEKSPEDVRSGGSKSELEFMSQVNQGWDEKDEEEGTEAGKDKKK